jgi:hypothetical protein
LPLCGGRAGIEAGEIGGTKWTTAVFDIADNEEEAIRSFDRSAAAGA